MSTQGRPFGYQVRSEESNGDGIMMTTIPSRCCMDICVSIIKEKAITR